MRGVFRLRVGLVRQRRLLWILRHTVCLLDCMHKRRHVPNRGSDRHHQSRLLRLSLVVSGRTAAQRHVRRGVQLSVHQLPRWHVLGRFGVGALRVVCVQLQRWLSSLGRLHPDHVPDLCAVHQLLQHRLLLDWRLHVQQRLRMRGVPHLHQQRAVRDGCVHDELQPRVLHVPRIVCGRSVPDRHVCGYNAAELRAMHLHVCV